MALKQLSVEEIQAQAKKQYEDKIQVGLNLSETHYSPWLKGIKDPTIKANCAILMENMRKYTFGSHHKDILVEALNETTYSGGVANWARQAFPLVRAVMPNLAAQSLVSVQPMDGPTALVFFLDVLYGTTKGATTAGTKAFINKDTYYTSQTVKNEPVATGSSAASLNGFLAHRPLIPGTVTMVYVGGTVAVDDGNGGWTGGATVGTINYTTGAYSITWGSGPSNKDVTATYQYNMEGNSDIPQFDLSLTSAPVAAGTRKLKFNLSIEAALNLYNQHGLTADAELTAYIGNELKYEIDSEIVESLTTNAIDNISAATYVEQFDRKLPSGIDLVQHYNAFYKTLLLMDAYLLKTNGRARAKWIVGSTDVCTLIRMMSMFDGSGVTVPDAKGVAYIGMLDKFEVYEDVGMTTDTFLVGCRPANLLDQGFVYAPYIPMYVTPNVMLDDFISRQGYMTQYATKLIHSDYYIKSKVVTT